eukprot:7110285-Prymnesium_polylepis.1
MGGWDARLQRQARGPQASGRARGVHAPVGRVLLRVAPAPCRRPPATPPRTCLYINLNRAGSSCGLRSVRICPPPTDCKSNSCEARESVTPRHAHAASRRHGDSFAAANMPLAQNKIVKTSRQRDWSLRGARSALRPSVQTDCHRTLRAAAVRGPLVRRTPTGRSRSAAWLPPRGHVGE